MTSFTLLVLSLALVCSPAGYSLGQTSDRASEHTRHPNTDTHTMKTRINIHTYKINEDLYGNDYDEFFRKGELKNYKVPFDKVISEQRALYDEIFIDDKKNYVHNNIESHNMKADDKKSNNERILSIANRIATASHNKNSRNKQYSEDEFVNKQYDLDDTVNFRISATKFLHFGGERIRKVIPEKTKINRYRNPSTFNQFNKNTIRIKRQDLAPEESICEKFKYNEKTKTIQHPHNATGKETNYYSNCECQTVIEAKVGQVIRLTFVDVFHIEEHPKCLYDYLEIRDGKYGYAKSLGRYCGSVFPSPLSSSGRFLWLKFKSDETIEYEGFTIKVEIVDGVSHTIPDECYMELSGTSGELGTHKIDEDCKSKSAGHALDVLWTITVDEDKYIFLNFTKFSLAQPNECEINLVQVFGAVLEEDKVLGHYCGSVANAVNTKLADNNKQQEDGNIMYVHLLVASSAIKTTEFEAKFTAFRYLNPNLDNDACKTETEEEFSCDDNTCIDHHLMCDGYANCRLKTDEDLENCVHHTESLLGESHILVILVIFSLIISGMSFVFLFKCIRKLVQDHKIIKEHIKQSTEDHLDDILSDSRFMLDAKRLHRSSEPRASLERENHTNVQLFKQQRSISQHKQNSIESDFQETQLDLDEELWRRDVDSLPEPRDLKLERNGRTRRDNSKKEESIRSRKQSAEENREIKDAAVGAPDTKESGCQTRESLFQADAAPSSDGSNSASNSRGFSTFGYSGATLARPSPPTTAAGTPPSSTPPKFSSTQIELLRQIPSYDSKKKIPDRRPMSAETTRSAPDVIIVSKPIR